MMSKIPKIPHNYAWNYANEGSDAASRHLQSHRRHLSHWDVAKKFHCIEILYSACKSVRFTNRYFCLNWLLALSEKQSMLSIVGRFAFRLLMILARKQLTVSLPCTISSLTMTKDSVVLSPIHAHTVNRVTCEWFR